MADVSPQRYDIHKAAGIIIQDRQILVERSKGKPLFKAPGGKVEAAETPQQALIRELKEEFGIDVLESDLSVFGTFCHPAAGQESKSLCMEVFMVHKWQGTISPNGEVDQLLWLNSQIPPGHIIGSVIAQEILPRLKSLDLID